MVGGKQNDNANNSVKALWAINQLTNVCLDNRMTTCLTGGCLSHIIDQATSTCCCCNWQSAVVTWTHVNLSSYKYFNSSTPCNTRHFWTKMADVGHPKNKYVTFSYCLATFDKILLNNKQKLSMTSNLIGHLNIQF